MSDNPPSMQELWAIIEDQRARLEAQERRVEELRASLRLRQPVSERPGRKEGDAEPGRHLSRRGLLKAAAMGAGGLVGAEALGTMGAQVAGASSDASFTA